MFLKDSRYKNTRQFSATEKGETIFKGIRPRDIVTHEGVIEHTVSEGDRLDLLARYYYNNSRLWYRIADANPEILFPASIELDGMVGHTILIPRGQ